MGGAAGHLKHVHEDLSLTFNDIIDIVNRVSSGSIEAYEKVDGVNLVFTIDSRGDVRTARNSGDLKNGGMTPEEYIRKWEGHPAGPAFRAGFAAIQQAADTLSAPLSEKIFMNGTRYANCEIIYPSAPNIINYNSAVIRIHEAMKLIDDSGVEIKDTESRSAAKKLAEVLKDAEIFVDNQEWKVYGPNLVPLENIANGTVHNATIEKLQKIAAYVGLDGTLGDLIILRAKNKVGKMIPAQNFAAIAELLTNEDADIKDLTQKAKIGVSAEVISDFVSIQSRIKFVKDTLYPVEIVMSEFAASVLDGMQSLFVTDHDASVKAVRDRLQSAIKSIRAAQSVGKGSDVVKVLDAQIKKLGDVDKWTQSLEGVVFEYPPGSDKSFKLTGNFSSINQILGKFIRSDIKSETKFMNSSKSIIRESLENRKTIGLLPMSAKPYHKGHHLQVLDASQECDEVYLLISLSDRARPGEIPVLGKTMKIYWDDYIIPSLPSNVTVRFVQVPVRAVYDVLIDANKTFLTSGESPRFLVYSDAKDTMSSFPIAMREKQFGALTKAGLVNFPGVERQNDLPRVAKGSWIREAISSGDFAKFKSLMPEFLEANDTMRIFGLLRKDAGLTPTVTEAFRKPNQYLLPIRR